MLMTQKGTLHIYTLMFLYSMNVWKPILESVVAHVHLSVRCHIFIGIPDVEFIEIKFCESMVKLIILLIKIPCIRMALFVIPGSISTDVSAIKVF